MDEHLHHRQFDDSPVCRAHSGVCMEMESMKENRIADNAVNTQNHEAQWRAIDKCRSGIDKMTRWITGAMGAVILAIFTWILGNLHIIK
jgi:hypothetical protein